MNFDIFEILAAFFTIKSFGFSLLNFLMFHLIFWRIKTHYFLDFALQQVIQMNDVTFVFGE